MNKTALFISTAALLTLAACNRNTTIRKSISYHGDIMRVEVYKKIDGKKMQDFKQEYNVFGMDKKEQEALAKRVMDSLEVEEKAER